MTNTAVVGFYPEQPFLRRMSVMFDCSERPGQSPLGKVRFV